MFLIQYIFKNDSNLKTRDIPNKELRLHQRKGVDRLIRHYGEKLSSVATDAGLYTENNCGPGFGELWFSS